MKKIIGIFFITSVVLLSCKSEKKEKVEVKEAVKVAKAEVANNIDVANSVVTWKGTKPTGSHNGNITLKKGALVLENGAIKSGEFLIDMHSINCLDLDPSSGKSDLESHLKNTDFFDVIKYPTAKFVITSVAEKEGKLTVTGNLTLKEITKSIDIPATISSENGITTFKSEVFNIDRTDFGVTYKSKTINAKLKDKFIDDLMAISFEVKTKAAAM